MNIDPFGWQSWWSPWLLTIVLACALGYGWMIRTFHKTPVPLRKQIAFYTGLICIYLGLGSPIDLYGHLMFTFHMVTMTLTFLIAPPLLLAGLTEQMLQPLGKFKLVRMFRFLIHPLVALVAFNVAFSLYHVPSAHDAIMVNYTLHTVYYGILFFTAVLMWFPIICPVPKLDTLVGVKKMGYIFANSVLLMPACALIIFANEPLYATYTDPQMWATAMGYCVTNMSKETLLTLFSGPQSLAWIEPLTDQQLGGVIMKLTQEFVYGTILVYVFRQWYQHENGTEHNERERSLDPSPSL